MPTPEQEKSKIVLLGYSETSLVPRQFFTTQGNWSGKQRIPFSFPAVAKIVT